MYEVIGLIESLEWNTPEPLDLALNIWKLFYTKLHPKSSVTPTCLKGLQNLSSQDWN
jgi:hypothetical protein